MTDTLNGATRIHYIVGDPIAQVKSPAGVTQMLAAQGRNAVCVPAHVAPADLGPWLAGVSLARNVDSVFVTVPHKFASRALCASVSERSAFLGAVNAMRRHADGSWHGDMFDGLGYVEALRLKGVALAGLRVLLVGAGGAGSAIAHALVMAGVAELAVHDPDTARRESLIQRLAGLKLAQVRAGTSDPTGFDMALNATPQGMRPGDAHPIDASRFAPPLVVGCVITAPAVPAMIEAARLAGCQTLTGGDMFACVRDLMVNFVLEAQA